MLFGPPVPEGVQYRPDFITADEERTLVDLFATQEFSSVEMRGGVARRRTLHYGWTYGYYSRRGEAGPPLPDYLLPFRDRAAAWAGVEPGAFVEALVTEYPTGAPIGWHRDAPMFGDVIAGISLLSTVRMKFRPYVSPAAPGRTGPSPAKGGHHLRRATHEIELAPRSGYLITGVARREFEHSIPPVGMLRYSVTFRTLRR